MAFEIRDGKKRVREVLRQDLPAAAYSIREALAGRDRAGNIYIATDEDAEGDVIAWDICRQILQLDRSLIEKVHRLRPRALTPQGLRQAINRAEAVIQHPDDMAIAAIPGRARAALDRWLGHALSQPGVPAGRVRSGLLGLLADPGTAIETGEAILRARSANGGPPFIARISLTGQAGPRLSEILARTGAGFVSGQVRPLVSVGSAAAIRIGRPNPHNTASALLAAIRHHGMTGSKAAAGLQSAYLSGMISYPRVDAHQISPASAEAAQQIAGFAGIDGFDPSLLSEASDVDLPQPKLAHEALHPLLGGDASTAKWAELLHLPDDADVSERDRMASIVARGVIDAGLSRELVPGSWDGPDQESVLGGLEWHQERGPRPSWTRHLQCGEHYWPQEAVLIDLMASHELARPSTYAFHANKITLSGDIEEGEPGSLPRPSPKGRSAIEGWARDIARPGMNRAIEAVLARQADPKANASIPDWISQRLAEALSLLSGPVRERLSAVVETTEAPPARPRAKLSIASAVETPVEKPRQAPGRALAELLSRARRPAMISPGQQQPVIGDVTENLHLRSDQPIVATPVEIATPTHEEVFPSRYEDSPGF